MVGTLRVHAATCVLIAIAVPADVVAQEPGQVAGRLRAVEIRTRDVFAAEEAEANPFYWFANALHVVTLQRVIECETWLRPGDEITWEQVAELERNLRAMSLLGAATVTVQDIGDGRADLLVDTRDRFSLNVSASLSRVGGVETFGARLSESNLFGTGKQLVFAAHREEDEDSSYVRFTDPQVFGSWHRFSITSGDSDEGPFTDVSLIRPFKHLEDPISYGVRYSGGRDEQDYYRFGETTAEVPRRRDELSTFVAGADGPRDARFIHGLELRLSSDRYGTATGPDAALWRVPGNTEEVEFGPHFRYEVRERYDKVTRLDAIDFVEDLELGVHVLGRVAARYRDEQGEGTDVVPVVGASVRFAAEVLPESYVTFAGSGSAAIDTELQSWNGSLALHAFQMSLPEQTLAGSLTFDVAGDYEDLVPQLTLGEDNGLRGYPAREFAGSRFVRLNLEDRLDTGIEFLSIHLGLVAFCDVGWVHGLQQGLSMSDAIRSVGCGLRFGSSNLFGGNVGRLDIAWPLDVVDGNDYGVSVSFSVGQVFTFFGNANELNTGF